MDINSVWYINIYKDTDSETQTERLTDINIKMLHFFITYFHNWFDLIWFIWFDLLMVIKKRYYILVLELLWKKTKEKPM